MNTKRTWKQCTNPDVTKLFNEVVSEAKRLYPSIFEGCEPELFINSSTKSLGRCQTEWSKKYYTKYDLRKDINTNQLRYRRGVILLSKYILHDLDKVTGVLCHELGHFVSPYEHHSYLWKIRANKIGEKWGMTSERLDYSGVLDDGMDMAGVQKQQVKYIVSCPKCNNQWKYKRMCKTVEHPEKFICSKCREKLIRVQ